MSGTPRVLLAMLAYNRPESLPRTIESILGQTFRDFVLLIVDDHPSPAVRAIVDRYAALDTRLVYEPNAARLGLIGNSRHGFQRARARHTESEYFAWVSDHDVYHPRWLAALVDALDAAPTRVLAYPQIMRIYPNARRRVTDLHDTTRASATARLKIASLDVSAGNAVYGLFRARALERAGIFRRVLLPDRQIIVALSVLGEFVHVPEILWYREVSGAFSYGRQRSMGFPTGAPLHTYLPVSVQHAGTLFWDLVVMGRGRPECGRIAGAGHAARALWYAAQREPLRDDAPWRVRARRILDSLGVRGRRPIPGSPR